MPNNTRTQNERATNPPKSFFARYSLVILMAFAFAAPLVIQAARQSVRTNASSINYVAANEDGSRTLPHLGAISGLLGIALAWWSLRSIRLAVIVFACGVLSAAAGLAIVHWFGYALDAALMSLPSLLYVLAICGAVHLASYYRASIKDRETLEGASDDVIRAGWKPAFLCSVATAIALGSLYLSDVEPIRRFGAFSAIGMLSMLLMLFLFLPSALEMWPPRARQPSQRRKASRSDMKWSDHLWSDFCGFLIRYNIPVMLGSFFLIALVGYGVTVMHQSIDLTRLVDGHRSVTLNGLPADAQTSGLSETAIVAASCALVVVIYNAVHFLTWFRYDLNRLRHRRAAIRKTYCRCAPPIQQAALISGLSLNLFILGTLMPTQQFGWWMMPILMTNVIVVIVILPAILASPFGMAFSTRPLRRNLGTELPVKKVEQLRTAPIAARPASKRPAQLKIEVSKPQFSTNLPAPHTFTLRDRLARLRRAARKDDKR